MPTLAIIGRPNVGKSTLFNRLIGKKVALVANEPGITRDYRIENFTYSNNVFELIDTAGIENSSKSKISKLVKISSEKAISKADGILFMVDARKNLTSDDIFLSDLVRKSDKKIILIANKCETMSLAFGSTEFYSLGFGEPLPISSEHNRGIDVLLEKIIQLFNDSSVNKKLPISRQDIMRISILGRPNSGKSTLTNYFLKETRQIVAEEAGITRDSISFPFTWKKTDYEIWDTAGLRKRSKVNDYIERLTSRSSLNAVKESNISILMIDALVGFDRQDANIANFIENTGHPFVVGVNKWDIVKDKNELKREIKEKILSFLPQLGNIPIINISAKNGKGVGQLMIKINDLVKLNNIRVQTNKLNKFLEKIEIYHPHPNQSGKEVRLKYITQITTNPPCFLLFSNRPSSVLDSYKRYLINNLRKEFDLEGVPIKINVRSSKNPYTNI